MKPSLKNKLHKINVVAGTEYSSKIILLNILLIFSAFLEMVGIGLIPILISSILDFNSVILSLKSFSEQFKFLHNLNIKNISINYFLISILIFFLLKNLFMLSVYYFESNLEYKIKKNMTKRLFSSYLRSSYENFFLKKNSSELIRNLAVEVANTSAYLNSIINFIRETSVLIFLLFLLLIANFKLTLLIIFFFSFIICIYYFSLNKKIKKSGKEYVILKEKIINKISQAILSIKEVIIYGKENLIYKNFSQDIKNYEQKIFFINFSKKIPRVILEISAVSLIIFFLLFFLENKNKTEIISVASLIAISAIRMIPSLNTISNSVVNMKFYNASFNVIFNEFTNIKAITNSDFNLKNISLDQDFDKIIFKDVSFSYDENKNFIFENLNLEIKRGQLIKILGNSGKGKSTFLNMLSGLLNIKSGSIEFYNNQKKLSKDVVKNLFAYVPQQTFILDGSIKDNILFGANENIKKLKKCIEEANLDEWIHSCPNGYDSSCGEGGINLSGGQKQRIAIARALYADKPILLFDEITNNLDNKNENKIVDTINKLKESKTILFITHKDNKNLLYDDVLNLN